ncbi:LysM peptidoglycan-binding domain-containing protein [Lactobacillus sp.]|uniref:LysM peptidoglycan-binding domain-containing protein n=1 Tax=Lactobacillus sp. TaxID=1591 RepID=UPI003EF2B712
MDQKERKVPSRLARQRAAREKRENRRAPWLTALLVVIIALLALVPLLNTSADLYQNPKQDEQKSKQSDKKADGQKDKSKTAAKSPKKSAKAKSEKTVTYYVQSGDYWASIAEKYGLTADELAKQNGMDTSQTLSVGQKLVIKTSK